MSKLTPTLSAECLHIEGNDALAFAQAQFSSDVRALQDGHWQWSAWLDARGRVRALLQLVRVDQTHLLALLRGGLAQTMADALRPFIMRSKVTLHAQSTVLFGAARSLPMHGATTSGHTVSLGCGDYALGFSFSSPATGDPAAAGTDNSTRTASSRLAAIRAGHPWLPDQALDVFVPQALSLERLGAVSFSKGCFPGQEITARLHYRGGLRKHLYRVSADSPLARGTHISQGDQAVGWVLDAAAAENGIVEALVVLDDGAAAAPEIALTCDCDQGAILIVAQAFGP